ncbi:hypothetical protein KU6B_35640 [Mameliella alba]|uniref:Uncharacterized protein n=2 Tax=Roseobacteraceae TaxID=2854170 RepID=A0A0B3S5I1_9RHOB|nr:hypothetical protein OA50_00854 [Mameliella alba]MBY6118621.1 hypothetical protein [Mameliella alba]OWV41102.1 hypothetical protein CDZ95_18835 [Mameliella alba]OWV42779.1 hypothetical protein CDZ96_23100 [Mameliella alba]OWV54988.1 hypothetical protein CDZ98_20345 [Mameliella alba]
MFAEGKMTENMDEIQDFLMSEREKVLSEAEWRFRMRGYGYNLRRTDSGVEVARLPQNQLLGTLKL